eukprot:2660970-Rhodomonas_salina.2
MGRQLHLQPLEQHLVVLVQVYPHLSTGAAARHAYPRTTTGLPPRQYWHGYQIHAPWYQTTRLSASA